MKTMTYTEMKNYIINRINTEHLPYVEEGEEFGAVEITEESAEDLNRTIAQELTVDTQQMEELFEELGLHIDLAQWVACEPNEMIATHLDTQGITVVPVTAELSIDGNYTITYNPDQKFLTNFLNDWAERTAELPLNFTTNQQIIITDEKSRGQCITELIAR